MIGKSIVVMLLSSYLFYNSWLSLLPLLPIGFIFYRSFGLRLAAKKEAMFREQFQSFMQALLVSLTVGYSFENAFREANHELTALYPKNSRMRKELRQICFQLDMNLSIEQILQELSGRIKQEELHHFVTIFSVAKKMGGDSVALIRAAVHSISEKIEVEQEIQVVVAAKKMEFQVMCMIPFGILLYMRLSFIDFMALLYGNVSGIVIMTLCLLLYLAAYWLGNRIVDIKV